MDGRSLVDNCGQYYEVSGTRACHKYCDYNTRPVVRDDGSRYCEYVDNGGNPLANLVNMHGLHPSSIVT